jgi:hypothetical protein
LIKNYSTDVNNEIARQNISGESLKKEENTNNIQTQNNTDKSNNVNQPKPEKAITNSALHNERSISTGSTKNPVSSKTTIMPGKKVSGEQSNIYGEKINSVNKNAEANTEKTTQPSANNITNGNNQAETVKQETKTDAVEKKSSDVNTIDKKETETISTNAETSKAASKNKKSFLSNIIFSISAGPDVSKAGQSDAGKVQLSYGAGMGYKISNRFSIHSGFYVGRKIYTAAPEDYNPPTNFWSYYPNLEHVDADCKVFEVPLNIYYDFGISKTQNWFVSAGLSSIFMKKEEYNYYFKPINSPQYIYYSRTYENKNKHYFSILNLSGGYARKITSTVSVKAEPYAKIALTGIGYGKVKLNSGGILFSATIQPFNSVNKKNKK